MSSITQKVVLRNEVVKVKGRVKAITIKKEDFDKFLKLTKLRVLNKEYEALMPPIENMIKNTIDVNGLTQLLQSYLTLMSLYCANQNSVSPAQMVLTTSNGNNITLQYTSGISLNSQGVTVFMQVFEANGQYNFQYYYVGFDTTNNSYTTSQAELYASASVLIWICGNANCANNQISTPIVRIAYSSIGLSKSSDEYLFLVWLIEFEGIPPYLAQFVPIFQNPLGIYPISRNSNCGPQSFAGVYFNNNNCNFSCGGNCPSSGLGGFITYIQNNSVIVEYPLQAPLGAGITNLEVLLCTTTNYSNLPSISGNTSTTLTSNVQGATFYVAIATITITYQGS